MKRPPLTEQEELVIPLGTIVKAHFKIYDCEFIMVRKDLVDGRWAFHGDHNVIDKRNGSTHYYKDGIALRKPVDDGAFGEIEIIVPNVWDSYTQGNNIL